MSSRPMRSRTLPLPILPPYPRPHTALPSELLLPSLSSLSLPPLLSTPRKQQQHQQQTQRQLFSPHEVDVLIIKHLDITTLNNIAFTNKYYMNTVKIELRARIKKLNEWCIALGPHGYERDVMGRDTPVFVDAGQEFVLLCLNTRQPRRQQQQKTTFEIPSEPQSHFQPRPQRIKSDVQIKSKSQIQMHMLLHPSEQNNNKNKKTRRKHPDNLERGYQDPDETESEVSSKDNDDSDDGNHSQFDNDSVKSGNKLSGRGTASGSSNNNIVSDQIQSNQNNDGGGGGVQRQDVILHLKKMWRGLDMIAHVENLKDKNCEICLLVQTDMIIGRYTGEF